MAVDITEFIEIDPDRVDAVFKAANGTPFLMIKQVADDEDEKEDYKEEGEDEAKKAQFCGDPGCEICVGRAAKGKLSMAQRKRIPKSSFAIPEKAPESGSYPIHDKAHARNALSRVAQRGTPEEKARVRRAVASKFPDIGKGKNKKKKGRKAMASQQEVEQGFHGSTPSPGAQMGQTERNRRGLETNKDVLARHQKPTIPDAGSINAEGEGYGDTAPEKDIHKDEAGGQTETRVSDLKRRQTAAKAKDPDGGLEHDMHEGRGDVNPEDVPVVAGPAHGQLQAQTETNTRKQGGGSDAVRDQMTRQREQAQKAFKFKVKKGGKKKRKKNAPLEISGAMKQSEPERVVSWPHATKELEQMTVNEFADAMTAVLDARDARKAAEVKERRKARKAKKAKKAKRQEEKKARKAAATTVAGNEEAAQEAAKSISPEKLVEGIGARVEAALKEAVSPLWGRLKVIEDQPARPRLATNNLAGKEPLMRDQQHPGSNPMDVLKPLEDAFKSEKDAYQKEKLGGELTKARLVIAERIRHGQPVSQNDVRALAAAGQ
jgi:hypothetical protein